MNHLRYCAVGVFKWKVICIPLSSMEKRQPEGERACKKLKTSLYNKATWISQKEINLKNARGKTWLQKVFRPLHIMAVYCIADFILNWQSKKNLAISILYWNSELQTIKNCFHLVIMGECAQNDNYLIHLKLNLQQKHSLQKVEGYGYFLNPLYFNLKSAVWIFLLRIMSSIPRVMLLNLMGLHLVEFYPVDEADVTALTLPPAVNASQVSPVALVTLDGSILLFVYL